MTTSLLLRAIFEAVDVRVRRVERAGRAGADLAEPMNALTAVSTMYLSVSSRTKMEGLSC
jgi:hypothetical protein